MRFSTISLLSLALPAALAAEAATPPASSASLTTIYSTSTTTIFKTVVLASSTSSSAAISTSAVVAATTSAVAAATTSSVSSYVSVFVPASSGSVLPTFGNSSSIAASTAVPSAPSGTPFPGAGSALGVRSGLMVAVAAVAGALAF